MDFPQGLLPPLAWVGGPGPADRSAGPERLLLTTVWEAVRSSLPAEVPAERVRLALVHSAFPEIHVENGPQSTHWVCVSDILVQACSCTRSR